MPLAQIYVPQGALTLEQRRAIVRGVTEVIVAVEKLPTAALPFVTVLINEVPDGGWGVGGHGYLRAELPQLIAGQAKPPVAAP